MKEDHQNQVLGPLNTSFEKQCKLASTLDPYLQPYFQPPKLENHLLIPSKGGMVFKALAYCGSLLPGKTVKPSFSPPLETPSLSFYSTTVDRGRVSAPVCARAIHTFCKLSPNNPGSTEFFAPSYAVIPFSYLLLFFPLRNVKECEDFLFNLGWPTFLVYLK